MAVKAETYQGKPCKRGHSGLRYRSARECVECHAQRVRTYRENLTEDEVKRKRLMDRQRIRRNPVHAMVMTAKTRATKKDIDFSLTDELIESILEACNYQCYYTGMTMNLDIGEGTGNRNPMKASIDRIDSSKGYTPDNIVLCCERVNGMKNSMSVDELKRWSNLIVCRDAPDPNAVTRETGFAYLFCPYCSANGNLHFMSNFHIPSCAPNHHIHNFDVN